MPKHKSPPVKQTIEVPLLTEEAQVAFDDYLAAAEKQRNADAIGRKQKAIKDDACKLLVTAMGNSPLARLPDGRVINKKLEGQDRKAQPAKTVEWWTLSLVE